MTFTSPVSLLLAVLIAMTAFVAAWVRRPALPRISLLLIGCGIVALVLASGGIGCRRGHAPRIAVMVDASPSTRGASFRDVKWVRARVNELIGNRPYELYQFSDSIRRLNDDESIEEMPADWTTFAPPPADRLILFSDGRFEAPAATPPIHVVIDPALASPNDASVVDLQTRGEDVVADVRNSGSPRVLTWENSNRHSTTAPNGSTVISLRDAETLREREAPAEPGRVATSAQQESRPPERPRPPADPRPPITETITAHLSPGDLWPENDALSIRPSPPMASQRWWVGASAPEGWMQISPANLPLENSAWLGPAIVVLNDIPADAFSSQQQDRLTQYVRDLGGALVISGGEHAFAAGHYQGTSLGSLSPLSSSPPEPVNHWVLLIDSSGSMSALIANSTRFARASDALVSVLRDLPKSDLVSIGSFARDLRWWSMAKKAADTMLLKLPPADVSPAGPTNLEAALQEVITSQSTSPPINLLVLTDAEARFSDASKLADELKLHHIRASVLLVGDSHADSPLHNIVASTGGQFAQETDPQQWVQSIRRMLRAAMPDDLIRQPVVIDFLNPFQSLASRTVSLANQTWLKQSATLIAQGTRDREKIPAAARWTVGTGQVVATAFSPSIGEIGAVERQIARHPRDPRFKIDWHNGAALDVRIEATDHGDDLNDQQLSLELSSNPRQPTPQTAPGRYEIELPAPRSPATATLYHDEQVLDRFALAGRYPREFDAIGNDLDALRSLANRSGGSVIEPTQHSQIEIPETREVTSMAGSLAVVGFLLIASGLVIWRRI